MLESSHARMQRLVPIAMLMACGQTPRLPDASTAFCTDLMPLAPTFSNVQRLFTAACTTCHTVGVELNLASDVSYQNLVGRTPPNYSNPQTDESCGRVLVSPGDPAGSYLFQKLSTASPCAGSQMPLTDIGTPSPLAPCALALIHDWIAAGALND